MGTLLVGAASALAIALTAESVVRTATIVGLGQLFRKAIDDVTDRDSQ